MASGKDRPTPPLTDVEAMLNDLELSTRKVSSETIALLHSEGVSKRSIDRIGRRAMNLDVPADVAEMADQLAKRMSFPSRSKAVELAIRFTVRAIHAAELVEARQRRREVRNAASCAIPQD